MTKKIPSATMTKASNDFLTEMDQLRQLVFGQAKLELEQKIDTLEQRLVQEVEALQAQLNERTNELSEQLKQQHQATLTAIEQTQSIQADDKAEFIEANKQLLSQLEMAENANRDDAEALHKRLDAELAQLDKTVQQNLEEVLARLEQVTKDLSHSKTDRRTLAQLLATMATDLESSN